MLQKSDLTLISASLLCQFSFSMLKGFTDGLECSSCVQLAKFGLEMLEADCRLCCTGDEESGEMKRYPSARLSICS